MTRQEDLERMIEIRDEMMEMLEEANEIAQKYNNSPVSKAVDYWYPHMSSSLGDGSFNMGTMRESINEIRNGDDE